MTRRIRTIYFIITVGLFLIGAPIIIFYIIGYRFSFHDQSFYQTGVFVISSSPKGAEISLNGLPTKEITPASFSNLKPGDYSVTLSRDDYQDWSASFQIKSKQSVNFSNIPLMKEQLIFKDLWQGSPILLIPDKQAVFFAAVLQENSQNFLEILNTKNNSSEKFHLPEFTDDIILSWSPNSKYLLLESPSQKRFRIIDRQGQYVFLSNFIPDPLTHLWWSNDSDDLLLGASPTALYQIDLFSQKSRFLFSAKAYQYQPNKSGGYFLSTSGQTTDLIWFDQTSNNLEILKNFPGTNYQFLPAHNNWLAINDLTNKATSLIRHSQNNELVTINLPDPTIFISWSNDDNLLTSDGNELRLYSIDLGNNRLITRKIYGLNAVTWLINGFTLIIANSDDLEIITLLSDQTVTNRFSNIIDPIVYKVFSNKKSLLIGQGPSDQRRLSILNIRE
ncbi:MAG: PEGA domain-containing protein [bacterium]